MATETETLRNYTVDKTGWDPGPWMDEPDRMDFVHAGYACLLLRHPRMGYWCGYVGVDELHPWFGKDWSGDGLDFESAPVNYADVCDGLICHVPEPGMPEKVWWFGFDLDHCFDFAPGRARFEREAAEADPVLAELDRRQAELEREYPQMREIYRDLAYARHMAETLARELRAQAG